MKHSLCLLLSFVPAVSSVVQVVFVGGQSNCQGLASKFHLQDLVAAGSTEYTKYATATEFSVRDDVYVWIKPERGASGPLTAKFGDSKREFGIELGAGWVLGDYFQEDTVFIVKHCEVLPLAVDWRPPSSDGSTGSAYQRAMETYQTAITDIEKFIPDYDGSGIETLAFVWIHGYADAYVPDHLDEYEANLKKLLQDVNTQFPIKGNVIVQSGGGGELPDESEAELRRIQASVANNPEFQSTTKLVETYQFSGGESVNGEDFIHYFGRADNYINIGEAVGNAIVALAETPATTPTPVPTTMVALGPTAKPASEPMAGPTAKPAAEPPSEPEVIKPSEEQPGVNSLEDSSVSSSVDGAISLLIGLVSLLWLV